MPDPRPIKWINALLNHPELEVLQALARGLPQSESLALTRASAQVNQTLLRWATTDEERAGRANNLSLDLCRLGEREAALKSAQEALGNYRKLAQANPDAYLPNLAGSLNNLGTMQSEMGQREAALESAQEAVEIRRKLAGANPDAYLPDLAMSLNNLGNRQSEMGQREAALESAQEAVGNYRNLAQANRDAYLPDLAMSFGAQGQKLRQYERFEESVAAFADAIRCVTAHFLRLPNAFAGLTGNLLSDYLRSCEAGQIEPNEGLIAPLLEVLQRYPKQQS